MSTGFTGDTHPERPFIARMLHTFAVPIILFWVAVTVILSLFVPSLEVVGQERSVSLSPNDAPSMIAMKRIGHAFNEAETDSSAMIVLEGNQPLGDDAHRVLRRPDSQVARRQNARAEHPGLLG
jgi:putative drug exporter of the RND superfamily